MGNTPTRVRKIIKISRKNVVIFILVVIVGLILLNKNDYPRNYINNIATKMESTSGISMPFVPDAYPNEISSIRDTREFMKVNYGAEIKTRDVKDVMGDVKNAIRDADGRIDNLNETPKYGYINFVIPKNNFNNFRAEIESLTNEKLYIENTSLQNLLTQKQSIEQQKESATASLAELQKRQKDLAAQHTQVANNLQKELTTTQNQLAVVRATISTTSDVNELTTLRNQEYSLSQKEASLRQNLNSENTAYAVNSQSIKNQINDVNAQLANIEKQDVEFTDNVETVNGYISVNWISLWNMAKIFSPIHPTIIIIILVLLAWYYLNRKNYLPSIEFV